MNMLETGIDLFVIANGVRLHYIKWPNESGPIGRPLIVLLHNAMASGHCWDLVAPHLSQAGHPVIAPDLRGRGRSE